MRKSLPVAVVATVLSGFTGYAVAHEISSEEPSSESRAVPVEECDPEVAALYEAAAFPRDGFYPECPTVEEAQENAADIAAAMERYHKEFGNYPDDIEGPTHSADAIRAGEVE
jgi:hypothetical protein